MVTCDFGIGFYFSFYNNSVSFILICMVSLFCCRIPHHSSMILKPSFLLKLLIDIAHSAPHLITQDLPILIFYA